MIIVEYVENSTETQTEVADKLWLYICQFVPPKIIISDQGTEFVNKIVQALLDKTGKERRVTSSYNPRTDGMCERANQTIIEVLRKHAEADHLHWDE